ncbi:MAG TPA: enoyl-CoA hydratase-related protein [Acidimicrobiales bacterium]|jgi:2-(1,2-epoxy-1,2-dihydrophenyl)acetyl-CoA isomerase|nr:enoyl-CoA hydratase-related protein [Acidimicrobiales bacterium]
MTDPSYRSVEGLSVEVRDSVLRLRLDRPDRRNAINDTMMAGLIEAVDEAGRDEGVRVIHIAGNGDHFCGGADIVARNAGDPPRPRVGAIQRRLPSQAHRLLPLLCSVQVPVVCSVRGWAAGIGMQIATAADFTVAAEDAMFWEPFSSRGFTPDSGATWLLPRAVGVARARELLLLGRKLGGTEAAAWGLVHRAVPAEEVDRVTEELVALLAVGPTVALGLTKWLLQAGASLPLEEHLRNEGFAMELSSRSEDFREGLGAFKDRRDPDFKGR